jgi:prophage tail gpP-like protein
MIMSTPTFSDQAVLVTGQGAALTGWTSVRVTRGIERMPADFGIALSERYTDDFAVSVSPGDAFQLMLGTDVVMTGYIDSVIAQMAPDAHTLMVAGRSKCADLVDCSAEWPGMQIMSADLLQIAAQLVKPYEGLSVSSDLSGLPLAPRTNILFGETAWSVIERFARFSAALVYDDPDGNLVITRAGSIQAAAGFQEGVNVESATVNRSILDRFSEYLAVVQAFDTLGDLSGGSLNQIADLKDSTVPRHRQHVIIAENMSAPGIDICAQRAVWEMNRRTARGAAVTLTTDSWRDAAGALWTPNTLAHVQLPTLKMPDAMLLIGEVTYRLDSQGTHADLTLMAPDAFVSEPYFLQPQFQDVLPVDTSGVR